MSDAPSFAVVGHPNKGKSSIVATLAQDDTVAIGADPGTTSKCRTYPMRVDDQLLYNLIDTPGFQRSRKVLHLLNECETNAADRPQHVRNFVNNSAHQSKFPDECQLLRPIIEGAGILYVVDGSHPYGPQYDAELEILRWTGQPRMALINPITNNDHVDEWKAALGQYFSVVRVFNAKMASFEKRTELLRAFGQLNENWRTPLEQAVDALHKQRNSKYELAATCVSSSIIEMLELQLDTQLKSGEESEPKRIALEKEYHQCLCQIEQKSRLEVESIYQQHHLTRKENTLAVLESDQLLSAESWRLFGLAKRDLLTLSAIGGAAVGGMIDASTAGSTFMMGSLVGGFLGASTAMFTADKLINVKILLLPLGKKKLVLGPTKSINFPHIVFARARLHHSLLLARTHAQREALLINDSALDSLSPINDRDKRALESCFAKIRKGSVGYELRGKLTKTIAGIFAGDEHGDAG